MRKKIVGTEVFASHLQDGMSIMFGGFMTVGTAQMFCDIIADSSIQDITLICSDGGYPNKGVGTIIGTGKVKEFYTSHVGLNPTVAKFTHENKMALHLTPQGSLAEKIRAAGAGLGGILTPTGIGTIVEKNKKIISVQGKNYILEEPLKADVAVLHGHIVDAYGNTTYDKSCRNFNPLMATAADTVFVCAHKIVDVGEIDPEHVITPHVFVDYIIQEE